MFHCEYCRKDLSSKYTLIRHQKTCSFYIKAQDEITIHQLREEINRLKQENNILKEQLCNTYATTSEPRASCLNKNVLENRNGNITNNNTTNNYNINNINNNNINNNNSFNISMFLTPITDQILSEAMTQTKDDFICSNPTQSLKPKDFISGVLHHMDLKNSMIITDRTRKKTIWKDGDDNNKLVYDYNATMILEKIANVPEYDEIISDITECNKIIDIDHTTDVNLIEVEEKINNGHYYNQLKNKNFPDDIIDHIMDHILKILLLKGNISNALVEKKMAKQQQDDVLFNEKWRDLFVYLKKKCCTEPFYLYFLNFEQTVIYFRNCFDSYVKETNELQFEKKYLDSLDNKDYFIVYLDKQRVSKMYFSRIFVSFLKIIMKEDECAEEEQMAIEYFDSLSDKERENLYGEQGSYMDNINEKKNWIYDKMNMQHKQDRIKQFIKHFFLFD